MTVLEEREREPVRVTGGKTPGEQLDAFIKLLAAAPAADRDRVASEWLAAMTKQSGVGWAPATVQAVAAAAQVAVKDPRAR